MLEFCLSSSGGCIINSIMLKAFFFSPPPSNTVASPVLEIFHLILIKQTQAPADVLFQINIISSNSFFLFDARGGDLSAGREMDA